MFDSGISASALIEAIKNEADIAIPIQSESYILWLNALEQLLYTELIKEQGRIELTETADITKNGIELESLGLSDGENAVRFEDIHAVYADETQLIKSTAASGVIFFDTYYKIGKRLGLNLKNRPGKVVIVYYVKPELKTEGNIETKNVMLPVEFLDLAKAKLRAESYKVANEDSLAAKWMNDYNVLLETFKLWLSDKQAQFGI